MPVITRLALGLAFGVALGLTPLPMPAALLASTAVTLLPDRSRTLILATALIGVIHARAGEGIRAGPCTAAFTDGARFGVNGYVVSISTDRRMAEVRPHDADCTGSVKIRLKRPDATVSGRHIAASGVWWSAGTFGGSLLADSTRVIGPAPLFIRTRASAQLRIRALFGAQAPLAESLLIAHTREIPPEIRDDFAASGLAHLLAISGTHVALVASIILLFATLLRAPRRTSVIVSVAGAWLYVLFLGAPFAALRSAIQLALMSLAVVLQRPAHPLALLSTAGIVILLMDPTALLDIGFQLSFAGILGLIIGRKPMMNALPSSLPAVLRDSIGSSIAAAIATAPITAYHFGQISLISIIANLAGGPVASLAVPAAALAVALDRLSPAAAAFLADGASLLIARLAYIARIAAAVPGGHVSVSKRQLVAVAAAGAAAMIVVARMRDSGLLRTRNAAIAAAVAMCYVLAPLAARIGGPARHSIDIFAIDVGQGDALVIRSPGNRWIVVDAGPRSDRFDAGRARLVPFLRRQGVNSVSVLVLTHPHLDHFGGAEALQQAIRTDLIMDPGAAEPSDAYRSLVQRAAADRRTWRVARAGGSMEVDGIRIDILHPDSASLDGASDANDFSVVFKLAYGEFAALFMGDAPEAVENALVARLGRTLDVDLLKVGHHGSATSTGDSLLVRASPEVALVSVGRRNRYGHPSPEVLDRLEGAGVRVLRTDLHGTIAIRAHRDGRLEVRSGL